MPRLKECALETASRLHREKTGVECDGFHPKITLDFERNKRTNCRVLEEGGKEWKMAAASLHNDVNETRREIVEITGKGGTKWKVAATSMHYDVLLDSEKNVTSERPLVLVPTLIRWWEALRAPEVAKWQKKYRVYWDATDGRNGGAQQTVWEILIEMERFKDRAGEEGLGAVAFVLDLAKAFERIRLPGVRSWATHFSFRRKILRVLCGYLEQQRRAQFQGCVAEPLQDALSVATKICPLLKLRVFVADITALLMGKNREVAEMAKTVINKLEEEAEKKGLKIVVH